MFSVSEDQKADKWNLSLIEAHITQCQKLNSFKCCQIDILNISWLLMLYLLILRAIVEY